MANRLYNLAKEALSEGLIDWTSNNIKVILVDTGDYTANFNTDQFLSIIPGAAIVATSANLTGKSDTLGIWDADDVVFGSVTGDQCEAIVGYVDSGVAATSRLLFYIDTGTGLPITPDGNNINLTWSAGANKILNFTEA